MKKSYQLCFARLLCIIVFSYFRCCFGLPTATFSCNRPSQSNHFVSNNAARVTAAQQMHARNQIHPLTKGMGNSSGPCGNSNTVQQKSGQRSHTKTACKDDQKKIEQQQQEQEQQKYEQEQKRVEQEKIEQQKRDAYIVELQTVREILLEQCATYEKIDDYVNSPRQQFDAQFIHVIEQVIDGNHTITSVEYALSAESCSLLTDFELNYADFAHCTGNVVQLQKHEEVVFLANEFSSLHEQPRLQSLSQTMYQFVDGARASNSEGNVHASCAITNFCWDILEYVKAVGTGVVSGAGSGLLGVAYTLRHPDHAVASLYRAGAFLAELAWDMMYCDSAMEQHATTLLVGGDVTYLSDNIDQIIEKYEKIGKAFNQTYTEFRNKPGPEQLHLITAAGTDFIVSGYTYGALARSAGCLYARAASQLKKLLSKCKKKTPAGLLIACAEEIEIKIAAETEALLEKAVEQSTKYQDCWCMSEKGCTIDGRYYTKHALERMAMDNFQVRAELQSRLLARGLKPKLPDGTMNKKFWEAINPRGIPPIVVEETIRATEGVLGKIVGTWEHIANGVKVVLNEKGDVVTVFSLSKDRL